MAGVRSRLNLPFHGGSVDPSGRAQGFLSCASTENTLRCFCHHSLFFWCVVVCCLLVFSLSLAVILYFSVFFFVFGYFCSPVSDLCLLLCLFVCFFSLLLLLAVVVRCFVCSMLLVLFPFWSLVMLTGGAALLA